MKITISATEPVLDAEVDPVSGSASISSLLNLSCESMCDVNLRLIDMEPIDHNPRYSTKNIPG